MKKNNAKVLFSLLLSILLVFSSFSPSYAKVVTPVSTPPSVANIKVNNYKEGIKDTVEIKNVASGDKVNIYLTKSDKAPAASAVGTGNDLLIELPKNIAVGPKKKGSILVSIKSPDKAESKKVSVKFDAEKSVSLKAKDVVVTLVKEGEVKEENYFYQCYEDPTQQCGQVYSGVTYNKSIVINNVIEGDTISFYAYKGDDTPILIIPVNKEDKFFETENFYGEMIFTNNKLELLFDFYDSEFEDGEDEDGLLSKKGDTLYITKTQHKKAESDKIAIKYKAMPSSTLSASNIVINNGIATNDTVTVTGLTQHDDIRLYNKAGQLIGYIWPIFEPEKSKLEDRKHIGWELKLKGRYPLAKLGGTVYASVIKGSDKMDTYKDFRWDYETNTVKTYERSYPAFYYLPSKRVAIKYSTEKK